LARPEAEGILKKDSFLPSPPPIIAAAAEEKDQHDNHDEQVGIHGISFL
jgi:hypothetical protein